MVTSIASRRLSSLAVVIALAAGLMGLAQGSSAASVSTRGPITLADSKLTLNAQPRILDFGQTIKVTGKLTVAMDDSPIEGATVVLSQRLSGQSNFHEVGTDVTSDQGIYVFRVKAQRFSRFRAAFEGDTTYAPSESGIDEVRVRRVVVAHFSDARIRVGQRTRLYGYIKPRQRGVDIAALVKTPSGQWEAFIVEKTGRNGTFSWPMTSNREGRFVIRVVTRASNGFELGKSRQLVLRAH